LSNQYLLTENVGHFPAEKRQGVNIITPAAFPERVCKARNKSARMKLAVDQYSVIRLRIF
jgi:hypothetical protein